MCVLRCAGRRFCEALQPWVHYIPFHGEFDSIFDLAQFLRAHDDRVEAIARAGKRFADALCKETAFAYIRTFLTEYSKLLKFKPSPLPLHAVSLRQALARFDEDHQEMERQGFKG